jgi:hypothetical protein
MLLWQNEFYYVFEKEELSQRQLAHPKPYSYQALELRRRKRGIVTKAAAEREGDRLWSEVDI